MLISFGAKGAKLNEGCGALLTCSPRPRTTRNEQTLCPQSITPPATGIVDDDDVDVGVKRKNFPCPLYIVGCYYYVWNIVRRIWIFIELQIGTTVGSRPTQNGINGISKRLRNTRGLGVIIALLPMLLDMGEWWVVTPKFNVDHFSFACHRLRHAAAIIGVIQLFPPPLKCKVQ